MDKHQIFLICFIDNRQCQHNFSKVAEENAAVYHIIYIICVPCSFDNNMFRTYISFSVQKKSIFL